MKKIILALLVLLTVGGFSASAQKIGHLNYLECLDTLQTYKTAIKKSEELEANFKTTMTDLQKEYERLALEYEQNIGTWSDIIRQSKERALQDLQLISESAQAEYQKNMEIVQTRYFTKMEEWLKASVDIVGKRRALDYILYFDEKSSIFWVNPDRGVDITNEVITEILKQELANPVKEPGQ